MRVMLVKNDAVVRVLRLARSPSCVGLKCYSTSSSVIFLFEWPNVALILDVYSENNKGQTHSSIEGVSF